MIACPTAPLCVVLAGRWLLVRPDVTCAVIMSAVVLRRPSSGSLMLYSRKKVRYRRDGYCWKKRKDGKTTREDHMKLKVQGIEVRTVGPLSFDKYSRSNRYVPSQSSSK